MYLRGLFRRIIEAMSEWDTNGRKALSRYSQCNLYLLVHATLALVRAELDRATGFMGNAMDCACPVARTCPINHRCRHRYLLLHQLRHQRRGNSRSLRCSAATCNQRPYRYVRNPMYLGAGLFLAGCAILFSEFSMTLLWYALGLVVAVNLFVLLYEEPVLRHKFGHDYHRFCASVPRWIPHLRRAR